MSADALFEIRNSFYLGDMQRCINEAQTLKVFYQKTIFEPA